jgi:hypothetical protein
VSVTTDIQTDDRPGPEDGAAGALDERLARGLGWFSIGLGVAEFAAPSLVARLIGVPDDGGRRKALRALGLREIASGVGILANPSAGWVWSRVGGDAMDLALLGKAFGAEGASRGRLAAATAAVAGVTLVDVLCSARLSGGTDGEVSIGAEDLGDGN